jgi:hypothetical protein
MGDHRNIEERVSGPMIAMWFGVDDIAQLAAPLDFASKLDSVARLMRRIDKDDAIGCGDDAVIGALLLSLDDNISCNLFHKSPLSREEQKYVFPQRRKGAKFGIVVTSTEGRNHFRFL